MAKSTRRHFIGTTATTGLVAGLGDLGFLSRLRPVSAAEASVDTNSVELRPEIEPIVRLIEQTPRDRLLEEVADRINSGLSYRELLAGLLLAGVKNVEPRPSVGHKFHTVLVVNSAHLASMSSPPTHRWLPIFWALDYFKVAAQRDVEERGDWTMSRIDDATIPSPGKATKAFTEAMDNWDVAAADTAIVGMARSAGAAAVYEPLFRYGMRDFRSIGHKAIYVANSWRTLQCIGWQHAEPVLRSLAYALLMHEGGNPKDRDAEADRPFRQNLLRIESISPGWLAGKIDPTATSQMVALLRTADADEACQQAVDMLNRGVAPQSIWDACFVAAGELLMRQPAIVALHAVTTTNALAFAYQACHDNSTRQLALLQNVAFLTMFRGAMGPRGGIRDATVEGIEPVDTSGQGAAAIDEIFADLSSQPELAARKALGHLRQSGSAKQLIDAARVLVFLKGDNAHDYKFSSAVLEDYYHISPAFRDIYLASNIFMLRGSGGADNELVGRTREALRA
jgi:hypothetical protein